MSAKDDIIAKMREVDSLAELKTISDALRDRWKELQRPARAEMDNEIRRAAAEFRIGQKVQFTHKGVPITGEVTKINSKTISVKTGAGVWNVTPTLLRPAQ
jgi:hypothetical protein